MLYQYIDTMFILLVMEMFDIKIINRNSGKPVKLTLYTSDFAITYDSHFYIDLANCIDKIRKNYYPSTLLITLANNKGEPIRTAVNNAVLNLKNRI